MKTFKSFVKENYRPLTKEQIQARRAQVDKDIADAQAKNTNLAAQKAASEQRAAESDKMAGREWADSKIDPIQKGVDYVSTGLAATQVGKPLAAITQGFSSAIDLTQGQYADSAKRTLDAVSSAIPGSEIAKGIKTVGGAALNPLSTGIKTAITSGTKVVGDTVLKNPTTSNLFKTGIEKATEKFGQEGVKSAINISKSLTTKATTDLATNRLKRSV